MLAKNFKVKEINERARFVEGTGLISELDPSLVSKLGILDANEFQFEAEYYYSHSCGHIIVERLYVVNGDNFECILDSSDTYDIEVQIEKELDIERNHETNPDLQYDSWKESRGGQ